MRSELVLTMIGIAILCPGYLKRRSYVFKFREDSPYHRRDIPFDCEVFDFLLRFYQALFAS